MLAERKERPEGLDAGEDRPNWEGMPNEVNDPEF